MRVPQSLAESRPQFEQSGIGAVDVCIWLTERRRCRVHDLGGRLKAWNRLAQTDDVDTFLPKRRCSTIDAVKWRRGNPSEHEI
jgi:hypothetical protein